MKRMIRVLLCVLCCSVAASAFAAAEEAGGGDMSLELYQKIKAHFDVLYGASSALVAVSPPNKAETEKALRSDCAENKDALIKALSSKKPLHRELAARALEYCGDKKAAVEALSGILNSDTDESVRRAIAGALAKLPDARSVDALVKGLGDPNDSIRGICASALGNIKDTRATEPLLKLLKDDAKPMVRLQTALSLSKIKDPASLEPLKKALDAEKDDRVKMAIAGALRGVMKDSDKEKETAEEKGPTAGEAANELQKLAKDMKEVEEKLREDRHDQAVQAQGSGIENKLVTLIEKLNKFGSGQGEGTKKGQEQRQMQQGNGNQKNNGPKNAGSGLKDSQLGSAVPPGAVNPAIVAGKQDSWAKLPPAQRDELLQAFREDMPERWKKRLEAYFTSIAAEEAKSGDSK
jgi:bilin biosynthesis protein